MKCKICKSNKSELVLETSAGNYLKCAGCGLVRLENMPEVSKIREIYSGDYFTEKKEDGTGADFLGEEKLYFARFNKRLNNIEKFAGKGRILDIGASVGQFLFTAKERGWDIYGLEISSTAVESARQRYGLDIQVGTLEDTDFKDACFDVITLWHVFEHFPNPLRSLKIIYGLLKQDGLLVMEVPNIGSGEAQKDGINWSYLKPGEHLYHYTETSMTRLLKASGFKLAAIEYESGGTGIGGKMDRMGIGRVKKMLSKLPFATWLRSMLLHFTAKRSREIMIVFALKQKSGQG